MSVSICTGLKMPETNKVMSVDNEYYCLLCNQLPNTSQYFTKGLESDCTKDLNSLQKMMILIEGDAVRQIHFPV